MTRLGPHPHDCCCEVCIDRKERQRLYLEKLVPEILEKKTPTISVHMHCTACGGSGVLGGNPCHCIEESERNFRSFAKMRADLLNAEATITSLCNRLDKINLIAHDRNTYPSSRLEQIRELSGGFMRVPTEDGQ